MEITEIQKVVKILRVDHSPKRSSTMRKAVDQKWDSETPTFRRETNQAFMNETKKKWTETKTESRERELNKVRCISQTQKDNKVLQCPVASGRTEAIHTLLKNTFIEV